MTNAQTLTATVSSWGAAVLGGAEGPPDAV